jgi:serine/threonine-protein kinase
LAGRWRDPLVGRDVLVGSAAGALVSLLVQLSVLIPPLLGRPADDPFSLYDNLPANGPIFGIATIVAIAVVPTLSSFFLFFIYFLLTRREWLAAAAFTLTFSIPACMAPVENRDFLVLFVALFSALLVFMYLRFGLLSVAAMSIANNLADGVPVTFDFSAWYAGSALVYLAVLIGLVVYGFVVASGGQALAWVAHVTGEARQDLQPEA